MATSKTNAKAPSRNTPTLRFAHPFFTTTPPQLRTPVPGFGTQLLNHIQGTLQPIPPAKRTPTMTLADVIEQKGSDDIAATGSISFHAVGDTGKGVNSPQGDGRPCVHEIAAGYGYLLVQVAAPDKKNAATITVTMFQVDPTNHKKSQYDQVSVNLATGKVH